jgi:hypothetical protein
MTQQVNEILQGFTQDQIDTLFIAISHCVGKDVYALSEMLKPHISAPEEELWDECTYKACDKSAFNDRDVLVVDIHLGGHLAAL